MDTATVPVEETWNLGDIYPDDESFHRAKDGLRETIAGLDAWKGRLLESAATLADALETITDAGRLFARLRCYGSLRSDRDTRVSAAQSMRQEVELLATDFSSKTSWMRPEILSGDEATIERFIEQDERLAKHAHFLRDLMRLRAHVLTPAEEQIMAATGLITRDPNSLYELLHNADLPRHEATLHDGSTVRATPVNFMKHRVTRHRDDRRELAKAYFGSYAAMRNTLGQNLFAAVKTHVFRTRIRGYESCVAAALAPENIPMTVYHNLIAQVREKLPLMHRYFGIRARALGVDRLEYHDLYPPLVDEKDQDRGSAEAMRLVSDSLAPLGDEYVQSLDQAFRSRWIDWHPSDGKRAGAYATGWAYDVHPYVLLNYIGDYDSVSTLAHEMGHAMHSFFSNRRQPFATADYSIFVAEVASTLNETLLGKRALELAEDRDTRVSLLAKQLDGMRGTLFRQTMFAEFELEIHTRAERGEVLTGELLDELYLKLLREYHGHDDGVMTVDDRYAVEWAGIPHFYYDFYVYQYATGIIAARALAEALVDGTAGARERYLEFLHAGGSDYPLAVLRRAGVDLETAAPYDAAMQGVERNLDALEDLLDGRGD
jgi:oligoendopeptidase F